MLINSNTICHEYRIRCSNLIENVYLSVDTSIPIMFNKFIYYGIIYYKDTQIMCIGNYPFRLSSMSIDR